MDKVLRTPDERFNQISGFSPSPHYVECLPGFVGLRAHYIDEGLKDSEQVYLCLHGEPTWAYVYRRMIPEFIANHGRVVAPDMLGFGRSDKPVAAGVYTFDFHRQFLIEIIKHLDLRNITLVCQDWGGILGLTLPIEFPERFKRLIVMNTMLATGEEQLSRGFLAWRQWVRENPNMVIGRLLKRACPHLSDKEVAGYNAPFPGKEFMSGVRRFPELVPDSPEANGAKISRHARDWWLNEWEGQAFMAVGMADPVLGWPEMETLHTNIRGCMPPFKMADGGHFLQEWGDVVAREALAAFKQGY